MRLLIGYSLLFSVILGFIGQLMYGSCQTSKLHYMVQCYYMSDKLPQWMWAKGYCSNFQVGKEWIEPYENYTGKWRAWEAHKIDNEYSECDFVDGIRHGQKNIWHENGIKSYEATYLNGFQIGKELSWYESGKKQSETDYGNGEQHQLEIWYFESGKVRTEAKFKNNERTQTTKYYENGNKKYIRIYENGQLSLRYEWTEDGTPYLMSK